MSTSDPGFPTRNGFALQADLENAELHRMLRLCLHEKANFTGEARLDWKRQWEYPFVIANLPTRGSGRRVLEAGGGFDFFAPLLAKRGFEVDVCDPDASIGPKYDDIAAQHDLAIEFKEQDLSKMTYADESFDHICGVGVLERKQSIPEIVGEFRRCLKVGGSLLITIGVSVDGARDLPIEAARQLNELLEEEFAPVAPFANPQYFEPGMLSGSEDVLRSDWFRRNQPDALPWRFLSRTGMRNLLRGRIGRPFFDLAVVGLVLRRGR